MAAATTTRPVEIIRQHAALVRREIDENERLERFFAAAGLRRPRNVQLDDARQRLAELERELSAAEAALN